MQPTLCNLIIMLVYFFSFLSVFPHRVLTWQSGLGKETPKANRDRRVEESMSLEEQLQYFALTVFNTTIKFLRFSVPIVVAFAKDHPTITNCLGYLLALYITWKVLCHLAVLVKRVFYTMLIVLCVAIYCRGLVRVVTQDVPMLLQIISTDSTAQAMWRDSVKYLKNTNYKRYYSRGLGSVASSFKDEMVNILQNV